MLWGFIAKALLIISFDIICVAAAVVAITISELEISFISSLYEPTITLSISATTSALSLFLFKSTIFLTLVWDKRGYLGIGKVELFCIAHQFDTAAQVQFTHDIAAVEFHGAHADV